MYSCLIQLILPYKINCNSASWVIPFTILSYKISCIRDRASLDISLISLTCSLPSVTTFHRPELCSPGARAVTGANDSAVNSDTRQTQCVSVLCLDWLTSNFMTQFLSRRGQMRESSEYILSLYAPQPHARITELTHGSYTRFLIGQWCCRTGLLLVRFCCYKCFRQAWRSVTLWCRQ